MSQLDELRHIIVGDNSEQLAELKDRIQDVERRTLDVAEVLSPAIDKQVASGNLSLADSLQAPVSMGLKRAIRSEPEEYAEILYPVMAPSIRRAISQAISSMMVTINRTIESATTVQGLSLRYESLRTGIPYAELALLRTILYRVEHLYLIHRETGMAIASLHANDTETLDSDAVSAMFSAIQSFVQDSFSQDETSRLTDLKVGEQTVWVAHGARAMLACVIRGDAPESLKSELYDTLDVVRSKFANQIVEYDGDLTHFDGVDDYLRPLLQSELKGAEQVGADESGAPQSGSRSIGATLLSMMLVGLVLFLFAQWFTSKSQVATVEHFLRETPGIAATDVYWDDGKLVIEGLQDPDAIIPYDTFRSYDIDRDELQFNMIPFRSLEVDMEIQRFRNELDLAEGVQLAVVNDVIQLYGEAPLKWLVDNDARIRQLAADRRLSIHRLSASQRSVKNMLRASFPGANFDNLTMTKIESEFQTTVVIDGQMSSSVLALVQAIFAGNQWVNVKARPNRSAS